VNALPAHGWDSHLGRAENSEDGVSLSAVELLDQDIHDALRVVKPHVLLVDLDNAIPLFEPAVLGGGPGRHEGYWQTSTEVVNPHRVQAALQLGVVDLRDQGFRDMPWRTIEVETASDRAGGCWD